MFRAAAGLWFLAASTGLLAQQQPAPEQPETPGTGVGESHVILVPFQRLDQLGIARDGQVILPAGEYRKLVERAQLVDVLLRALPTRKAVLRRARYRGRVEGNRLLVDAELELEALGAGWAALEWNLLRGAIASVRGVSPNRTLVRALGPTRYQLLVAGPGTVSLQLELLSPVRTEPGARHFTLFLPPAGVATLEVELPGTDLTVKLTPELVFGMREADGHTTVRVNLGGQQRLTVSWYPKAAGIEGTSLLTADVEAKAQVQSAVLETDSLIRFRVLRGAVEQLQLVVPEGHRILSVESEELRRWTVHAMAGSRRLQLELYRPVSEDFTVQVRTDRPLQGEQTTIELPLPQGVARVAGALAVDVSDDLLVVPGTAEGVVQVHRAEMPDRLRDADLYFRFYTAEMRLPVTIEPLQPWLRSHSWTDLSFRRGDLHLRMTASLEVQRAGIFALSVRLPSSFVVESVRCPNMDRYDVRDLDQGRQLRITFRKRQLGKFALELVGVVPLGLVPAPRPQRALIELPQIEEVDREDTIVRVTLPESLTAVFVSDASKGVVPVTLGELAQQQPEPPSARTTALFRVVAHPARIALELSRRPARVLADVATVLVVHESTATVRTTIHYRIDYSGISRLEFLAPQSVVERLHLQAVSDPPVRQWRHEPYPKQEGWHRVTVDLQQLALGHYSLMLEYELPLRQQEGAEASTARWQPVQLLNVARQEGEVGISRDEGLSVTARADGAEEIDPRELRRVSPGEGARLAYRYVRHPVTITLSVTRPPVHRVAETLVRRTLTECLIPSEGQLTCRTVYLMKTTERQRLRLSLHRDARILAVSVAGRAVLPEVADAESDAAGRLTYYVPVTRESDVDDEFALVVQYQLRGSVQLSTLGALSLYMPVLGGDVAQDEQLLLCWLPRRWYAVTASGMEDISSWSEVLGFIPARPAGLPPELAEIESELNGWLAAGPSTQRYALYRSHKYRDQVTVRYVSWPVAVAVCSGALFLLAVVLLPVRFEWRATATGLALLSLLAVSFARSEYAFLLAQASLPGALLGLLLWTTVGGVRILRHVANRPRTSPQTATADAANDHTAPEAGDSKAKPDVAQPDAE